MTVKAPSPEKLGRRIRKLRQDKNMSQEDLAHPDYTAAYISHIEHGKRRASREVLSHISARLGMTLEQLVSGRDPDEDLRLEVAAQRAIAEIHQGRAEDSLSTLEQVRSRATRTDNQRVAETAETAIGLALYRLGRIDEALAAYERALSLMEAVLAERRTTAIVGKARCLVHSNEANEAVYVLETHLKELERLGEPDPGCLVETYAGLIPAYFETGMMKLASHAAMKGWKLASKTPDAESKGCLYVNRAQLLVTEGHPREALAALSLAEDLYRHLGWYSEVVKVALARSFVLTEQGEWSGAEELIRGALASPASTVSRADRIRTLTRLAFIRRNRGDAKEALDLAKEALRLAGARSIGSAAEAEREIGLCLLELDDPTAALASLRHALKKFSKTGEKEEVAATARMLGDHLADAKDLKGAAEAYRMGLAAMESGN